MSDGAIFEMNQLNEHNSNDSEGENEGESGMDRIIEGRNNLGLESRMGPNEGVEGQSEERIGNGLSMRRLDGALMTVGHSHEFSDNRSKNGMLGDSNLSLINEDIRNMGLTKNRGSNFGLVNANEREEGFTNRKKDEGEKGGRSNGYQHSQNNNEDWESKTSQTVWNLKTNS